MPRATIPPLSGPPVARGSSFAASPPAAGNPLTGSHIAHHDDAREILFPPLPSGSDPNAVRAPLESLDLLHPVLDVIVGAITGIFLVFAFFVLLVVRL